MTNLKAPDWLGDYDLRGMDIETALVGEITDRIIDAARLVRLEWQNGMPNWLMYRVCLAGDRLGAADLRYWTVAFTTAYCMDGGIKRQQYSDELACWAAWDALHMLMHRKQLQPYTTTAEMLGVHHKTYKRLRETIFRRMAKSLSDYWLRLGAAYRQVLVNEQQPNASKDCARRD